MKRSVQTVFGVCFAAVVGVASVSQADSTFTFEQGVPNGFYPGGYAGNKDANIFFYTAGSTDNRSPNAWMRVADNGTGNSGSLRVANAGTNIRNLLQWDLGALTGKGVTVTSDATLKMRYTSTVAASYSLYQIAPANAGWTEPVAAPGLFPLGNVAITDAVAATRATQGDPTWYYKSIDVSTYTIANGGQSLRTPATGPGADTTSVKWASGHVQLAGAVNSNPEGYAMTGGLWNPIDLVDANPATPVTDVGEDPATYYLRMAARMDAVASASILVSAATTTATFTIPKELIQFWIDNPAENAGFLGRSNVATSFDLRSKHATENATVGFDLRPELTFSFVPEPTSLAVLAFGSLLARRR